MSGTGSSARLTWSAGGAVLGAAGLLCVALLVWAFAGIIVGHRPQGGSTLESYGFTLASPNVPLDELHPTGEPRDFVRTLEVTAAMPAADMLEFNRTHRKRYVVSDDRVIVVTIGEETRAYPLSVVQAHEVVQDTLAGVPIAVTYSPFCDSVAVFDRRVGAETLDLHVSGLVREANTVLYDRRAEPSAESLWQQLDGRALAGPAAADAHRLTLLPGVSVTTWVDYLAAYPHGSVMQRDESHVALYQRISYRREHESPTLPFPVARMPSGFPADLPAKGRVVVLMLDGRRAAVPIDLLRSQGLHEVDVRVGDAPVTVSLHLPPVPGTVRVVGPANVVAVPTFLFAAHSLLGLTPDEISLPTHEPRRSPAL